MTNYLVLILLIVFGFSVNRVDAQDSKKENNEKIIEIEEDDLDSEIKEESKGKKKKEIKKPKMIDSPARDAYAEQTWQYYQTAKEITRLSSFIRIKITEVVEPNSEVTQEMELIGADGKSISFERGVKQLQELLVRAQHHEKEGKKLEALSKAAAAEKIPLVKQPKAMAQYGSTQKIQALSIAEIGKTVLSLGKNIATLIDKGKR